MNILFITEIMPYPLDSGGKIRTYNILKQLSMYHKITLIFNYNSASEKMYITELESIVFKVIGIPRKAKKLFKYLLIFFKSFSSRPVYVSKAYSRMVKKHILRLLAEQRFHVVHFDHLDATVYYPLFDRKLFKVVDEHNVVSSYIKQLFKKEKNVFKKVLLLFELKKISSYEVKICNRMDLCLSVSEIDKKRLINFGVTSPISVIPNGVNLEYFGYLQKSKKKKEQLSLVFVGSFDYYPNREGFFFFYKNVMPVLKKTLKDIRLNIIGREPSEDIKEMVEKDKSVIIWEKLEDIRAVIRESDIYIVPLNIGSGTRLKILEAMALGIPVVSTSLGAEGINVRDGEGILLVNSGDEMAKKILELFSNQAKYFAIAQNARRLVEEKYGWNLIGNKLQKCYESLNKRFISDKGN